MNTEALLSEIRRAAQSAPSSTNSSYNGLSNAELLINDIRRLEQIRPELNQHLAHVRELYTEQVTLTNRVTEALKIECRGSTQGISSILESNGRASPNTRSRPSRNDNPFASLLSMFAEIPLSSMSTTMSSLPRPQLLTTEDLTQFPIIEYANLDDQEGNCSICQDTFTEDKGPYRKLPCNHLFHTDCIDRWLTTQNIHCPTCRSSVMRMTDVD